MVQELLLQQQFNVSKLMKIENINLEQVYFKNMKEYITKILRTTSYLALQTRIIALWSLMLNSYSLDKIYSIFLADFMKLAI